MDLSKLIVTLLLSLSSCAAQKESLNFMICKDHQGYHLTTISLEKVVMTIDTERGKRRVTIRPEGVYFDNEMVVRDTIPFNRLKRKLNGKL